MHGLSTETKHIIKCLSLYKDINYHLREEVTGKGIAFFASPPVGSEEKANPYIEIINANSDKIYQACKKYDPDNTRCIMNIIRERYETPVEDESLFYIIFVLLHEAGHWYDYHNRRDWYNKNYIKEDCEAEEYRQRPCEESADRFAMDHFEEAWKELMESFPSGLMEPLMKQS